MLRVYKDTVGYAALAVQSIVERNIDGQYKLLSWAKWVCTEFNFQDKTNSNKCILDRAQSNGIGGKRELTAIAGIRLAFSVLPLWLQ